MAPPAPTATEVPNTASTSEQVAPQPAISESSTDTSITVEPTTASVAEDTLPTEATKVPEKSTGETVEATDKESEETAGTEPETTDMEQGTISGPDIATSSQVINIEPPEVDSESETVPDEDKDSSTAAPDAPTH